MMPREILTIILLILLIVCAIAVNVIRNLLQAVITFMAYSFIMALIWILMESPDLGITEAAVGAGVSGIMFLMTLKKIRAEDEKDPADLLEERRMTQQGALAAQGQMPQQGALTAQTQMQQQGALAAETQMQQQGALAPEGQMPPQEGSGDTDQEGPGGSALAKRR